MTKRYKTVQEDFWAGDFGNEYIDRNNNENIIAGNLTFFSDVFRKTGKINSAIEFGSNIGMNIHAILKLQPDVEISAIEINQKAVSILQDTFQSRVKNVYNQSILDFEPDYKRDFVYIKGVLTHINPDYHNLVYKKLYDTSSKYIMLSEYYNLHSEVIPYRGYDDRIFRKDWAKEFMELYPDVELVDYNFYYHGDRNPYIEEDTYWFLFKKNN